MASKSKASGSGTADGTSSTPDLYLVVTERRESGFGFGTYFHLDARVSGRKYESYGHVPYGADDTYGDGLLWSGLRASCQGDDRSRLRTDGEVVYGYRDVEYVDVHSGNLRTIKRMAKTLEKIERGLSKLSETRGYARSYGEWLGRVAEVLGCQGIGVQKTPDAAARTGQTWDWYSIGDGVNAVTHRIYLWHREALDAAEAKQETATAGETEQAS